MGNMHNELRTGLDRVTELLSEKRGLWNKYIAGQEFSLEIKGKMDFKILTTYRDKSRGRGIYAEIKISDGKLDGFITPMKSAKPVADFLHAFSHRYNVPLGLIGSSLEYSL